MPIDYGYLPWGFQQFFAGGGTAAGEPASVAGTPTSQVPITYTTPAAPGATTGVNDIAGLKGLLDALNEINRDNWNDNLNARVPGIATADTNELRNIKDAQNYILPEGLKGELANAMATRGVSSGSLGDNVNAGYGSAVTQAMLERADAAGKRLLELKQGNPPAELVNAGSFAITPEQQAELDLKQRALALQEYLGKLDAETRMAIARLGAMHSGGGGGGGGGRSYTQPNWADIMSGLLAAGQTAGATNGTPGTTTTGGDNNFVWVPGVNDLLEGPYTGNEGAGDGNTDWEQLYNSLLY